MKQLIDDLQKRGVNTLRSTYISLYGEDNHAYTKSEYLEKIVDYYHNEDNYRLMFTDGEYTFLVSDMDYACKKATFSYEITSLKNKKFIYYDSSIKEYVLYEDLIPVLEAYKNKYDKEDIERYGLYQFLMIAFINAYGIIKENDLEKLFEHYMDNDFDIVELLDCINESHCYYGRFEKYEYDDSIYYILNGKTGINDLIKQALYHEDIDIIDEYYMYDEEALEAFFYEGYNSTNEALNLLERYLYLTKKKDKEEFAFLVQFTYSLMQPRWDLVEFILDQVRYEPRYDNHDLAFIFKLADSVYQDYGCWLLKGHTTSYFENMFKEEFGGNLFNEDTLEKLNEFNQMSDSEKEEELERMLDALLKEVKEDEGPIN